MIITAKKRKAPSTRRTWSGQEISAVPEKEFTITEAAAYVKISKAVFLHRAYKLGILIRNPIKAEVLRAYMKAWSEEQYVTL